MALEEHSSAYRVDGEVGRFKFTTHKLIDAEGKESFSTEILGENGFNLAGAALEEAVVKEVNFVKGGEINSEGQEMIDAWKEADIPDSLKSEVKSTSIPYERAEETVEINVDGV